jgi:hypothetical protein
VAGFWWSGAWEPFGSPSAGTASRSGSRGSLPAHSDEPAVPVLAVGRILDVSATEGLAATGPADDGDALCLALEKLVARSDADLVGAAETRGRA